MVLPDGTLRRTLAVVGPNGERPLFAESCARGQTPPPPTCLVPDQDAATLLAAVPGTPEAVRRLGITGVVAVVVALDEDSNVISATVQTTPSALLMEPALEAARKSLFQTTIRESHRGPVHLHRQVRCETGTVAAR